MNTFSLSYEQLKKMTQAQHRAIKHNPKLSLSQLRDLVAQQLGFSHFGQLKNPTTKEQNIFDTCDFHAIAERIFEEIEFNENFAIEDYSGAESTLSAEQFESNKPIFFNNINPEKDSVLGNLCVFISNTEIYFNLSCNGETVDILNYDEVITTIIKEFPPLKTVQANMQLADSILSEYTTTASLEKHDSISPMALAKKLIANDDFTVCEVTHDYIDIDSKKTLNNTQFTLRISYGIKGEYDGLHIAILGHDSTEDTWFHFKRSDSPQTIKQTILNTNEVKVTQFTPDPILSLLNSIFHLMENE